MSISKRALAIVLVLLTFFGSANHAFAADNTAYGTRIDNVYPSTPGKYIGFVLVSNITLGWYGLAKENKAAKDLNTILGEEKLLTGWKLFLLDYITCGIYDLFWTAKFKNLLNEELSNRGIDYRISWWLIFADYKLFKGLNLVIDDYNAKL